MAGIYASTLLSDRTSQFNPLANAIKPTAAISVASKLLNITACFEATYRKQIKSMQSMRSCWNDLEFYEVAERRQIVGRNWCQALNNASKVHFSSMCTAYVRTVCRHNTQQSGPERWFKVYQHRKPQPYTKHCQDTNDRRKKCTCHVFPNITWPRPSSFKGLQLAAMVLECHLSCVSASPPTPVQSRSRLFNLPRKALTLDCRDEWCETVTVLGVRIKYFFLQQNGQHLNDFCWCSLPPVAFEELWMSDSCVYWCPTAYRRGSCMAISQ